MKYGSLVLAGFIVCTAVGFVFAEEKATTAPAATVEKAAAVEFGNKTCPISGQEVGKMGPAHPVEYKGKVYNLCCAMCEKDFNKDPEAYIKKLEEIAKEAPAATTHGM